MVSAWLLSAVVCCCLLFCPFSQVKQFGKPTWRKLVEAVENKSGGNHPALAEIIAKKHLGKQPYLLVWYHRCKRAEHVFLVHSM